MAHVAIWQVPWALRSGFRNTLPTIPVDHYMDGIFPYEGYRPVFAGDVEPVFTLDDAWFHFNRGTDGWLDCVERILGAVPMHSLSVGDVVVMDHCQAYRVASIGWTPLPDWSRDPADSIQTLGEVSS